MLVLGDGAAPTGFARVVRAILEPVHARYDIHHLAINYSGDPHDWPWKLYPALAGGDQYGFKRLPSFMTELTPDLVFIVNNASAIALYMSFINTLTNAPPVIAYCPIEGGPLPLEVVKQFKGLSTLVLYTAYARDEFEKARSAAGEAPAFDVQIIPHGVDTRTFRPLGEGPVAAMDRAGARVDLLGEPFRDAFIVLNANRNQSRKRIDTTIEGFALFARDKPSNVQLYLHMGAQDMGWNLLALATRWGIEARLILTSRMSRTPHVTDDVLNIIYNACDVGINTSSSEGWGLVSFEHAATGAAQLVPNHTAGRELWSGAAEMLEPAFRITDPQSLTDQHLIAPEEVAQKLEKLYADPVHRAEVATRCHARATNPNYQWPVIAAQWAALFARHGIVVE